MSTFGGVLCNCAYYDTHFPQLPHQNFIAISRTYFFVPVTVVDPRPNILRTLFQ